MSLLRGARIGAHLTTADRNKYLARIGVERSKARGTRPGVCSSFCLRFRLPFKPPGGINETNIPLRAQLHPNPLSGPEHHQPLCVFKEQFFELAVSYLRLSHDVIIGSGIHVNGFCAERCYAAGSDQVRCRVYFCTGRKYQI